MQKRLTLLSAAFIGGLAGSALFLLPIAHSQSPSAVPAPGGPYMIAGGDRNMVWRIDQSNGHVSYCMRDNNSTDPAFITQRAPYCSAFSAE